MAASKNRPEIVTFKADRSLIEALTGVANRSEFIRNALLAALENICPLCRGRGILTANQRRHWSAFAEDHGLSECHDCHELHLTCPTGGRRNVHPRKTSSGTC